MWSVLFPDSSSNCTSCKINLIPSVLHYLIFILLQTPKWKCKRIWATLFGSGTSNGGTVHRLSHIGLLNTKYTGERIPSLDEGGSGREGVSILLWGKNIDFKYSLSFFSFFLKKYPLLISSIVYSPEGLQVPTIHMYSILLFLIW